MGSEMCIRDSGNSGCLPELTRDSITKIESRWSCSENLGQGNCYVEYTFVEPQDVISMNIAFYKGDERKRKIKVCSVVEHTRYLFSSCRRLTLCVMFF